MGIAQLDIPPFSTANLVNDFMDDSFKIVNSDGALAHIMISGTHAYLNEVYEDFHDQNKMAIPIGPMLTAKMMNVGPGESFVSLSGSPHLGNQRGKLYLRFGQRQCQRLCGKRSHPNLRQWFGHGRGDLL